MKKHFSKIFAMFLVLSMLLTQLIIPASAASIGYCGVCGEDGVRGDLLHTIDPTCGADGFKIYDCVNENCGGTITVRVAATGVHKADGNVVKAVEATCTEEGALSYELCVDCGCYLDPTTHAKLNTIVVPANGHSYDDTVTPPTCTDGGFTTHVCSVCGDTYEDAKVDCTGHKFDKDVEGKEPTCREEGYTAYVVCSVCGVEDPENKKTVLPVEDHNLKNVEHVDPTCTENGKNVFKCEELTCPYYNGITEVLVAPGHKIVKHDAKTANCVEDGYGAYETCEVCDYTTYDALTEVAALGHTEVSVGYIAPTCTEIGYTDAIVCDRCGVVHHPGEEIAATGHNLEEVDAVAATCTEGGNIAHKKCLTCNELFAADVENDDIDAAPLTNVKTSPLDHDFEYVTIAPTCTEIGYVVRTCKRDDCGFTKSEVVAATGHAFTAVEEVPAKCLETGVAAHNKCDACGKLFAKDADASDIKIAEVTLADLTIDALGHKSMVVEKVNPTYDAAGNEAGEKCERCDTPLVNADKLDELDEGINFHYVVKGVNGSDKAVNSGYVTVEIYFDVLKSINDKDEYNSDVIANIYGLDYTFSFAEIFKLTNVTVAPGLFAGAEFTPYATANENGAVEISQDMISGSKAFRGTDILFATLTFQVSDAAAADVYEFTGLVDTIVHTDGEEVINVTYVDSNDADISIVEFEVIKLGDANGDTEFNVADTHALMSYYNQEAKEYNTVFDMDKDGDVDFVDFGLLRKAIVGNNEYLDFEVDPNTNTDAEV